MNKICKVFSLFKSIFHIKYCGACQIVTQFKSSLSIIFNFILHRMGVLRGKRTETLFFLIIIIISVMWQLGIWYARYISNNSPSENMALKSSWRALKY